MRSARAHMLARAGAAAMQGARRSRLATVLTPPILAGATYAGGSPSVTPPVYSDAGEPDSYSLRVNGVEVESGDAATIEAYVYTLGDEGYTAVLRAIRSGFPDSDSAGVEINLATKILAVASAASIAVLGLFLARRKALDVSVVSDTHVETWVNRGTGSDATQATDSARPTWSDSAINSLPGMTLDGGDALLTGAIASSAFSALALGALFRDTDTAARFVLGLGSLADECVLLNMNAGSAGTLDIYADGTAGAGSTTSRARSAASFAMTDPAVVTGTWDIALASSETEIRHAGVNVTDSRPNDGNNTSGLSDDHVLTIGAREATPTGNMTGAMSAAYLLAHTGAWSGAQLTALATIEALLAAAWRL